MRSPLRLLVPGAVVLALAGTSCASDSTSTATATATTTTMTTMTTTMTTTTSPLVATQPGAAVSSATTLAPGAPGGATGPIVVFAASSLTGAFGEIATAFTSANPSAKVTFDFAGSGDLVTQIVQGAPADVFASADESNMTKLTDAGEASGAAVPIARNTMEIIVESGNPKGITGLADLARPGLVVVLCADTAPCGKSAAAVLKNAGVTLTPKSLEDKVKGVVTKVTTGEADAGIVFATDVQAAGSSAAGVEIPTNVNVINKYPIVVTKSAGNPSGAQAFVEFVAGPAGRAIMAKYGFLAP